MRSRAESDTISKEKGRGCYVIGSGLRVVIYVTKDPGSLPGIRTSPPYSSPLKDNVLYPYGPLPIWFTMTLLLAKQGPPVENGTPQPRLLKVRIKAYRLNTILLVHYLMN